MVHIFYISRALRSSAEVLAGRLFVLVSSLMPAEPLVLDCLNIAVRVAMIHAKHYKTSAGFMKAEFVQVIMLVLIVKI